MAVEGCASCGRMVQRTPSSAPRIVCHPCRRERRGNRPSKPKAWRPTGALKCANCGKPMFRGRGTLPQGEATCHPCRRAANPKKPTMPKRCQQCGGPKPSARHRYCTTCGEKRRRASTPPKASAAERGYGYEHQRQRAKWLPIVKRGDALCHAEHCIMESRHIEPWELWDLGHTPDRSAWTGPEHRKCNRSEGAARGNRQRGRAGNQGGRHGSQDW